MTQETLGFGKRPVDLNDQPTAPLYGKYRGIVAATNDPSMRGRVRVTMTFPFGDVVSTWAEPCFPPGSFLPPKVGDGVWIEFEQGDPQLPIWVGQWYRNGEAPHQAAYHGLQSGDEESTRQPEDDLTHKEFHDHAAGEFYSPHVRVIETPTGHILMFDDFQAADGSKAGLVLLMDRDGRVVRLCEASDSIDLVVGDTYVKVGRERVEVVGAAVYLGQVENAKKFLTEDDGAAIEAALNDLRSHTHSGVTTGGGVSGPPATTIGDYTPTPTENVRGT